jgi:hypothetical protein
MGKISMGKIARVGVVPAKNAGRTTAARGNQPTNRYGGGTGVGDGNGISVNMDWDKVMADMTANPNTGRGRGRVTNNPGLLRRNDRGREDISRSEGKPGEYITMDQLRSGRRAIADTSKPDQIAKDLPMVWAPGQKAAEDWYNRAMNDSRDLSNYTLDILEPKMIRNDMAKRKGMADIATENYRKTRDIDLYYNNQEDIKQANITRDKNIEQDRRNRDAVNYDAYLKENERLNNPGTSVTRGRGQQKPISLSDLNLGTIEAPQIYQGRQNRDRTGMASNLRQSLMNDLF